MNEAAPFFLVAWNWVFYYRLCAPFLEFPHYHGGNSVLLSSPDVWTVFVSENGASVHPQHTGLLAAGLDFSVMGELPVERPFPEVRSHHMRNLNVTSMPSYSGVLGAILP